MYIILNYVTDFYATNPNKYKINNVVNIMLYIKYSRIFILFTNQLIGCDLRIYHLVPSVSPDLSGSGSWLGADSSSMDKE